MTADSKGDPIANQFIKDAEDIVLDLDSIGKVEALKKTLKGIGLSRESVDVKNYKRARLNAAVVLAMTGAYAYDQTNNMRDASECGTNTLCAYKHEWPIRALAGFLENAKMSSETEGLWIELDGSEEHGMFYLASPCKADLTVRKTKCNCKEYYGTSKLSAEYVIQEWGSVRPPPPSNPGEPQQPFMVHGIKDTFNFHVDFPEPDRTATYRGPIVTFMYRPECEDGKEGSSECKQEEKTLNDGNQVNPVMLSQALASMNGSKLVSGGLTDWVKYNLGEIPSAHTDKYAYAGRIDNNFEQGTVFKKCVKGDWWSFWDGPDKSVECIKIKAEGYADYVPNFCYERKWDRASKAQVGIFAVEIVAGTVAAVAGGAASGGAGAMPAYCLATTAVSAVGAWVLAEEMRDDKWPYGIIDK